MLQRILRIRNASRVRKEYRTLLRIRLRLSSIIYRMCHHKWYDSVHSQRPPNWQPLFSPYTPTYPTRPTVSSNGTFTEEVSRYVNYSLNPFTPGFHCTSGTPTSSTNSRSYPHYQLALPWTLLTFPPYTPTYPTTRA